MPSFDIARSYPTVLCQNDTWLRLIVTTKQSFMLAAAAGRVLLLVAMSYSVLKAVC